MDSNHRSQRQQIYSLPPLAAREPHHSILERVKGIEPSRSAWKAEVLPLNYTRNTSRSCSRYYTTFFPHFKPGNKKITFFSPELAQIPDSLPHVIPADTFRRSSRGYARGFPDRDSGSRRNPISTPFPARQNLPPRTVRSSVFRFPAPAADTRSASRL